MATVFLNTAQSEEVEQIQM